MLMPRKKQIVFVKQNCDMIVQRIAACNQKLACSQAPMSTSKFSRLISVHFFKEFVEMICLKIKHFLVGNYFINSQPYLLISIDFG